MSKPCEGSSDEHNRTLCVDEIGTPLPTIFYAEHNAWYCQECKQQADYNLRLDNYEAYGSPSGKRKRRLITLPANRSEWPSIVDYLVFLNSTRNVRCPF